MSDGHRAPDGKGILHPEGMRAARHLAAGVVHEVNNVLGVVLGNAYLAKKSAADPASVEKYVAEIRAAAEGGRELMRKLGELASAESLCARTIRLNDLVAEAVSEVRVELDLDLAADDPIVVLDLWLAQECLRGLAQFMADSPSVGFLRVTSRVTGDTVALTFEDDGGCLNANELRALFAPFAKAERRPRAGMGLSRLADLAARFDGYLVATNREPRGLRIVLTLPIAAANTQDTVQV